MSHAVGKHGKIDYLVNNGGGQFMSPFADMRTKGWKTVIELNLNGTYHCLKHGEVCAWVGVGTYHCLKHGEVCAWVVHASPWGYVCIHVWACGCVAPQEPRFIRTMVVHLFQPISPVKAPAP